MVHHGETLAEAATHACAYADEHHLVFIHPHEHDAIIAGQGTLALELLKDVPVLVTLAVPVGGGLLAGFTLVAAGIRRSIDVVGVEVETYAAIAEELADSPSTDDATASSRLQSRFGGQARTGSERRVDGLPRA